jgi:hypothetical protein
MVKALTKDTIILGLSDENLKRLKNGEPIKFNLNELGLDNMNVVIFNGKDEQEMYKMFKDNINPFTTVMKNSNADKK